MHPWRPIAAGIVFCVGAIGLMFSDAAYHIWALPMGLIALVLLATGLFRPIADYYTVAAAARNLEEVTSVHQSISTESQGNNSLFVPPPLDR